jgi:tRNA(fMet)-specific endonuclease VapC
MGALALAFCVDTSVLVEHLRDSKSESARAILKLQDEGHQLFASAITIYELSQGAHLHPKKEAKLKDVLDLKRNLGTMQFDQEAGIKAGEIDAELQRGGQPIGIRDVLIASTAVVRDAKIVSKDVKHFSRINGLTAHTPADILKGRHLERRPPP